MILHRNEPREVGYAKEHEDYYQNNEPYLSLTHKDAKSIFVGLHQKDLFIFAMAIGKYHNKMKTPKEIRRNVSVSAMNEQQKWAVLALGLSEDKEILSLENEKPFYTSAEEYACAGMDIMLKDIQKMSPVEYCQMLEKKLIEILED